MLPHVAQRTIRTSPSIPSFFSPSPQAQVSKKKPRAPLLPLLPLLRKKPSSPSPPSFTPNEASFNPSQTEREKHHLPTSRERATKCATPTRERAPISALRENSHRQRETDFFAREPRQLSAPPHARTRGARPLGECLRDLRAVLLRARGGASVRRPPAAGEGRRILQKRRLLFSLFLRPFRDAAPHNAPPLAAHPLRSRRQMMHDPPRLPARARAQASGPRSVAGARFAVVFPGGAPLAPPSGDDAARPARPPEPRIAATHFPPPPPPPPPARSSSPPSKKIKQPQPSHCRRPPSDQHSHGRQHQRRSDGLGL